MALKSFAHEGALETLLHHLLDALFPLSSAGNVWEAAAVAYQSVREIAPVRHR